MLVTLSHTRRAKHTVTRQFLLSIDWSIIFYFSVTASCKLNIKLIVKVYLGQEDSPTGLLILTQSMYLSLLELNGLSVNILINC